MARNEQEYRTIKDALSEAVSDGFKQSSDVVIKHTSNIIGDDILNVFNDLKNFAGGFLKTTYGTFKTIFGSKKINEEMEIQKDQRESLRGIFKLLKRQYLEERAEFKDKKQSISFKMLLFLSGMLVGYLEKATQPFIIFIKAIKEMKITKSLTNIGKMIAKNLISAGELFIGTIQVVLKEISIFIKSKSIAVLKELKTAKDLFIGTIQVLSNELLTISKNIKSSRFLKLPVKIIDFISNKFKKVFDIFIFIEKETKTFSKSIEFMSGKISKVFDVFSKLKNITTIFSKFSEGTGKVFGNIISKLAKIGPIFKPLNSFFGTLGKMFGNLFFYIRAFWGIWEEFNSDKNIRDKILGMSTTVLGLITEVPELIINGIMKLFGSDFRVDFSKDAIIKLIEDITKWMWKNVTEPIFDWLHSDKTFGQRMFDVVNKISEITSWIPEKLMEWALSLFGVDVDIDFSLGFITEWWGNLFSDLKIKTVEIFKNLGNSLINGLWEIGNFFLDTLPKLIKNLGNSLINGLWEIGNFFLDTLPKLIKNMWNNTVGTITNIFSGDGIFKEKMFKLLSLIWDWFINIPEILINKVLDFFGIGFKLDLSLESITGGIKEIGGNLIEIIKGYWDTLKEKFFELIEVLNPLNWFKDSENGDIKIMDKLAPFFNFLNSLNDIIINWIKDRVRVIIDPLPSAIVPDFIEDWVNKKPINEENVINEKNIINEKNVVNKSADFDRLNKQNVVVNDIAAKEIQKMSDLINKNLQTLNQNVKEQKTNQIELNSNILSSRNSQVIKGNNIPDSNQFFGISLMNGEY